MVNNFNLYYYIYMKEAVNFSNICIKCYIYKYILQPINLFDCFLY